MGIKLNADGSVTHTEPDGSTNTDVPDNRTRTMGIKLNADGSVTHTEPDGSTNTDVPPHPSSSDGGGAVSSKDPDGK